MHVRWNLGLDADVKVTIFFIGVQQIYHGLYHYL